MFCLIFALLSVFQSTLHQRQTLLDSQQLEADTAAVVQQHPNDTLSTHKVTFTALFEKQIKFLFPSFKVLVAFHCTCIHTLSIILLVGMT